MRLVIDGHGFKYELESLTMMFFPGQAIETVSGCPPESGDYLYTGVRAEASGRARLFVRLSLNGELSEETGGIDGSLPDFKARCERELALMCFRLLSARTGIGPKWGILTGVRPVKLMRALLASRLSPDEAVSEFSRRYMAGEGSARLALEVALNEAPLLAVNGPNSFSLYVSIPFCPTRCRYCSFVSQSVERSAGLVEPYLEKLFLELAHTGALAERLGMKLCCVYIGGGTPTTLSAKQLGGLLCAVEGSFDLSSCREYTVEAGRPDTITREKLRVLREGGVSRVSVNPQTMNDGVLRLIGRNHTARETREAYAMARTEGFGCVNMDVIAGLPGDTREGFQSTVDEITGMEPENITVHTLSVKRASDMGANAGGAFGSAALAAGMLEYAGAALPKRGYAPYYLYRQKKMLGNLENTGYTKPGKGGIYNALIMEETHTILAAGAGGVSKLCGSGGKKIERIFNYKLPYEYIRRFDDIINKKSRVEGFF